MEGVRYWGWRRKVDLVTSTQHQELARRWRSITTAGDSDPSLAGVTEEGQDTTSKESGIRNSPSTTSTEQCLAFFLRTKNWPLELVKTSSPFTRRAAPPMGWPSSSTTRPLTRYLGKPNLGGVLEPCSPRER